VPAKRAKGIKKTKLVEHEIEGAVVRKIFSWRVAERLGFEAIADRLNEDLVTNPPPTPIKIEEAVGRWTGSGARDGATPSTPATWCGTDGRVRAAAVTGPIRSTSGCGPRNRFTTC
jgi:hypothetical protein